MNRRQFLRLAAAILPSAQLRGDNVDLTNSLLMMTADEGAHIRQTVPTMRGRSGERVQQLRALAQREMHTGPWSVTSHRPENSKFDAHDYFSEGPYFWPNPKDPNGPYIRRDGERNPNRFVHNRNDLGAMSTAVLTLGTAAYLFDDAQAAQRAAKDLQVWFIDQDTRMNPNLEHGQAIRGVNDGRGTGLIDTVSLIQCCQGILLLEKSGKFNPALAAGTRQWFSQFLSWMVESDKGKKEGKSGNNHATWWTAQVAAYATLTLNQSAFHMACERYRNYLVPQEIKPDGSCPREEARTNSLSYSVFNADAFATLCRIAQSSGVDLWSFTTSKGISYQKLVRYVEPFVIQPDKWKGQQLSPFRNDSAIFLGLAGAGLHTSDLIEAYKTLPRADSAWINFVDLILV